MSDIIPCTAYYLSEIFETLDLQYDPNEKYSVMIAVDKESADLENAAFKWVGGDRCIFYTESLMIFDILNSVNELLVTAGKAIVKENGIKCSVIWAVSKSAISPFDRNGKFRADGWLTIDAGDDGTEEEWDIIRHDCDRLTERFEFSQDTSGHC